MDRKASSQSVSMERWARKMNEETVEISKVIQKAPQDRTNSELERILPFLSTRSELLNNLQTDVLFELIRHCRHLKCRRNDVIVKQGTIGNCFYIILTGQTSVYIDSAKTEDVVDDSSPVQASKDLDTFIEDLDNLLGEKAKPQDTMENEAEQCDRSTLGRFIMVIESGKSFGEVALLSDNAERNASVVADMDGMELLVVDKELYNRTVKERQMAEYQDKRLFISSHPLFKTWGLRMQRLLEMSMTKHNFSFDNTVVKQGDAYDGLHFVISGQAKVLVDPHRHKSQYPRVMNCDTPAKNKPLTQTMVYVKRNFGYVEAEKLAKKKNIQVALLTAGDVFGDLESAIQLPTYLASLQCVSQTVILHINAKNFDRLVVKKNPRTQELFREMTFSHLTDMLVLKSVQHIPLFQAIYDKFVWEEEPVDQTAAKPKSKEKTEKEQRMAHLLQLFTEGKMQLFEPWVPDSVYFRYKSIERRKQSLSARDRILKEQRDNSVNGKLRSLHEMRKKVLSGNGRRARSRRELANVTLDEFIATQKVIGKYTEYRSKELVGDKKELPHHANPVSVSPPASRTPQPLSRTPSAKNFANLNDSPLKNLETRLSALQSQVNLENTSAAKSGVGEDNYTGAVQYATQSSNVNPMTFDQSESTQPTNQSLLLDENILRDALGDNSLVAFFNVLEAIDRRRQMNKYKSRPVSAPNRLYDYREESEKEAAVEEPDDLEYVDSESDQQALTSLENRVSSFHKKLMDRNTEEKVRVTRLKRCDIQRFNPPVAGGTVFVRLRPCSSKLTEEGVLSDHHHHVKRYILPKLKSY